jgi:drug/metabolite transporter (DMT)-like permease
MLVYALLVSTSFTIGKRITPFLDPMVLTTERFLIASVVFGVWARHRGQLSIPSRGALLRYAIIGCTMVVYFVMMFAALREASPQNTGALFATVPLLTASVAFFILKQRSSLKEVSLMGLGALGAMWIVFDGDLDRALALRIGRGEGIFLIGCLSFAFYSPLIRRWYRGEGMVMMTFWILASGFVVLALVSAPKIMSTPWFEVPWWTHLGVFVLGTLNTGVTFWLASSATAVLPSAKVMSYTYLTPVFVVGNEVALGLGFPSAAVVFGLTLTVAVTFLLQRQRPAG